MSGRWLIVVLTVASSCAPDCPEPAYQGGGTDEAWRTMVDAEANATTGADAAQVHAPGTIAAAGDAPTFTWSSTIARAPTPPSRVRVARRRSPLDALTALVIPVAHAHEAPVTDDVYWARIAIEGEACRVEVVTTDETWTLDGDAWERLAAAKGRKATLSIVSAYLTSNRVSEGPYRSNDVDVVVE